jgi:hypothetical protein
MNVGHSEKIVSGSLISRRGVAPSGDSSQICAAPPPVLLTTAIVWVSGDQAGLPKNRVGGVCLKNCARIHPSALETASSRLPSAV